VSYQVIGLFTQGFTPAMRPFFCKLNRHRPIRSEVTWDGLSYVSKCQDCGQPIHRQRHRVWRKETEVEA